MPWVENICTMHDGKNVHGRRVLARNNLVTARVWTDLNDLLGFMDIFYWPLLVNRPLNLNLTGKYPARPAKIRSTEYFNQAAQLRTRSFVLLSSRPKIRLYGTPSG
jgi:hypothetical protein